MLVKILDANNNVISLAEFADASIGIERMIEAGYAGVHADVLDLQVAEKKANAINLRKVIYAEHDSDALLGKTANFTAATAAIILDIFGKMLTANSLDELKAAIKPYEDLILRLQEGFKSCEFKSVITAQGMNHTEAVIEGLKAYTKVAEIFEQQETVK